jgi:glucarate dehydratase
MVIHRRDLIRALAGGMFGGSVASHVQASTQTSARPPLTITGLKVTPIALPDPPLLAASGCHGPYFLRNIVELRTEGGIVGIGETHGGESVTTALERARKLVTGQNAFAYRKFAHELQSLSMSCYAGIELACLDACSRAADCRLCELVGGPVRDRVEFAAYLFFRYAADHPVILSDPDLITPG